MSERAMGNGWPLYNSHAEVLCFQCDVPTDNATMEDTMPSSPGRETEGLDIGRYFQVCPQCGLKTFYNLAAGKELRYVD
jgi:hypothetical protein